MVRKSAAHPTSAGVAGGVRINSPIEHPFECRQDQHRKVIGGDDLPTNCMCPVTSLRLTAGQTTKPLSKGKARRGGNRPSRAVRLWMLLSLPSARVSRFSLACRADFLGCGAHLSCADRTYFLRW